MYELYLQEAAQATCYDSDTLERARVESRREAETLFGSLLARGYTVRWYRAGRPDGDVEERLFLKSPDGSDNARLLEQFTRDLRYYRFVVRETSERVSCPGGISVRRQVALVAAGPGIADRRVPQPNALAITNHLMPVHRHLQRAEGRVYRVPLARSLTLRHDETDRGRGVRSILARNPGAWIEIEVLPLPPDLLGESRERAYLERALGLYGETPIDHTGGGQEPLAVDAYRNLLAENRACSLDIRVSDMEVFQAFLLDTDPVAFTERLSPLGRDEMWQVQEREDGEALRRIIATLTKLYSLGETTSLLTPAVSFGDALPGTRHFTPLAFARTDGRRDTDAEGGILLGYQPDGTAVRIDPVALTRGMLVNGPPGVGKTTFLITLILRLWAAGLRIPMQTYDPVGEEFEPIYRDQLNARIIDFVTPGRELFFNPFWAAPRQKVRDHAQTLGKLLASGFPANAVAQNYLSNMVADVYLQHYREVSGSPTVTWRDIEMLTGVHQRAKPTIVPTFDYFCRNGLAWLGRQSKASEHFRESLAYFEMRIEELQRSALGRVFRGEQPVFGLFDTSYLVMLKHIQDEGAAAALLNCLIGLNFIYCSSGPISSDLRALCLIDEGHLVLSAHAAGFAGKDISASPMQELARLMAKQLRTTRKYGLGTVVADHSVSNLIEDVLIACSSIVAMKTQFGPDQEALGKALDLPASALASLSDMPQGAALARLDGIREPVYFSVDRAKS